MHVWRECHEHGIFHIFFKNFYQTLTILQVSYFSSYLTNKITLFSSILSSCFVSDHQENKIKNSVLRS